MSIITHIFKKLKNDLSWLERKAAQQEAKKKKEEGNKTSDGEAGHEEEEEEKVIFVHYEQRKVMLSQLHPIENGDPDPATGEPSELRQVQGRRRHEKSSSSYFVSCLLTSSFYSLKWALKVSVNMFVVYSLHAASYLCPRCSRLLPAANLCSSWTNMTMGRSSQLTGSLKEERPASSWSSSNSPLHHSAYSLLGCSPYGHGSVTCGKERGN